MCKSMYRLHLNRAVCVCVCMVEVAAYCHVRSTHSYYAHRMVFPC